MTDLKKCETCRLRKIKCDKKRPRCDNCGKKSRPCHYRYDKPWTFVPDQSENQSRQSLIAPDLKYRMFRRAIILSSVPGTGHTALAARWVAATGPMHSEFNLMRPLGRWTNSIPSQIGSSQSIDLAVAYFLDSFAAHFNPSEANLRSVHASGARATKSLRLSWENAKPQQMDNIINLMLAIELHFTAELFRGVGTRFYILHMRAVSTLFKSCDHSILNSTIVRSLFSSIYYEEIIDSLWAGTDSRFDDPFWLSSLKSSMALQNSPLTTASAFIMENILQIPRLARLIRLYLNSPDDPIVLAETTHLVQMLYQSDFNQSISQIIEEAAPIVPTRSLENIRLIPQSYHFKSSQTFKLVFRYYSFRILLYGLIQHIDGPISIHEEFNASAMKIKGVQAAHSITMCADYALNSNLNHTTLALHMMIPLHLAFGAWHRFGKTTGFSAEDYERAHHMKEWCFGLLNQMNSIWKIPFQSIKYLEREADALGGRQTPIMKQRMDPLNILTS